jgi:hypothetical protein
MYAQVIFLRVSRVQYCIATYLTLLTFLQLIAQPNRNYGAPQSLVFPVLLGANILFSALNLC